MREIKFQVLLDNKVVGYERLNESGWQWMWLELNPKNFERWVNGVLPTDAKAESRLSKVVRRMFTGLHDKNGKEIYEKDVVKTATDKAMVVGWSDNYASFCLYRDGWAFKHFFGEAVNPDEVEIIGNIHWHQELTEPVKTPDVSATKQGGEETRTGAQKEK